MSNENINTNITISYPGPDWEVLWTNGRFGNVQLDIVGFLAILGEGSVTANYQVSALSTLFYLPRILPAPQALLWPSRADTLKPAEGVVTGVESGNVKKHVHHVADVLLGIDMQPFMVRCVEVKRTTQPRQLAREQTWADRFLRGEPSQKEQEEKQAKVQDEESQKTQEEEEAHSDPEEEADEKQGVARTKTQGPQMGPPLITAKSNGPLAWVTLSGTGLSVALFTVSLVFGDGMSLIATILLSLLSTLIGFVNGWSLKLPQRPKGVGMASKVNVVIRYQNGSFLVVKCDEDIARELYFAPEEIDYKIKNQAVYRLISLVGTLMLMLGVIALANAKLELQIAWTLAFIIANALHWIAAAMPAKAHWNLSCYEVKEQAIVGDTSAPTFTEALWKVVLVTKNIRWVKLNEAAPQTEVWDEWLEEALVHAKTVQPRRGNVSNSWNHKRMERSKIWDVPRDWDAKKAWNRINSEHKAAADGATTPLLDPTKTITWSALPRRRTSF